MGFGEGQGVVLTGPRVRVRAVSGDDAPRLAKFHRQNADFLALTATRKPESFFREADWRERIRSMEEERAKDQAYRMVIVLHTAPEEA